MPRSARGRLTVGFSLSRPANVKLVIETPGGVVARDLGASSPAPRALVWDGRLPQGSPAFAGSYVAHVFVTSAVGTSERHRHLPYRR